MKKGFTLVEIIVSISLIVLISVTFLIINNDKSNNEKKINQKKENILLSSDIFLDKYNIISDISETNICIQISKLYELGLIDDETYKLAQNMNYVFVQYPKDDNVEGTLVSDSNNCTIIEPDIYKPEQHKKIEIFINVANHTEENEIMEYINKDEFKEYLENINVELNISFANFVESENNTYEYKTITCSTGVNNDTIAFLGNYIIIHYWDSGRRERRFTSCNVVSGDTSNPFKNESGNPITPTFGDEYVTRFYIKTPWDDVDTSETYDYFITDSSDKKLVYQIHESGETDGCDINTNKTQLTNAGFYGYYYLKWNYCSLDDTNDSIKCKTEIEKEVYSGAQEKVCRKSSDRKYEYPNYEKNTHFNLGDQSMIDGLKYISSNIRKAPVYDYIGGIPSVPDTIKNNLTIDNLYALGKLPTGYKYNAFEVTAKGNRIYYKNGDWYGTPIYVNYKSTKSSSYRYYYYIIWVKENNNTIYLFNNQNNEGSNIDCSNYLCLSYKQNISRTGVKNILSIDDIKDSINEFIEE